MEEISALIIELLKTHNRVSLPGVGAFVASPQAAIIDKEAKTITPPSKRIIFSKNETWNDGFLEQAYAERRGVSLDEARDRLRHVITDIRFELDATGKMLLPGLGTLKQSQARDISFGLNKNLNLKGDSFGLSEVKIEPSAGAFKLKKLKNIKPKSTSSTSSASVANNLPMLMLLGVMLVIISALVLYLFLSHGSSKSDDLFTPPTAPSEVEQPAAQPQPAVATEPTEYIVHTPPPAVKAPAPAAPKPQAAAASSRCEYCVVATSLSTEEGAQHKSQQYRDMGYKSTVVNSGNNRYRVTLGCYRTHDAARRELRKTQEFITDAWILEDCE